MSTDKANPLEWFEDNMIVYVDGFGEMRAHHPRRAFWLCSNGTVLYHREVTDFLINNIVLSSVTTNDYRFWICDMKVHERIKDLKAYNLPALLDRCVVFDTANTVLDVGAIHAEIPLEDEIANFLRSLW